MGSGELSKGLSGAISEQEKAIPQKFVPSIVVKFIPKTEMPKHTKCTAFKHLEMTPPMKWSNTECVKSERPAFRPLEIIPEASA